MNIISFSAGTTISWSSPVIGKLTTDATENPFSFKISEEEASWISALLNLGAAIGPFLFGNLTDRIGRKFTILGTGIPLLFGQLLMSFVDSVNSFYIGRFLCGLSIGGIFNVIPVYVAEIANAQNRGVLSCILNLFVCAGVLFSYSVGPFISVTKFNMILAVFPALFLISFYAMGPESAYFDLRKGKFDLAKQSLQKVRGCSTEVGDELRIMQKNIIESGNGNFLDILKNRILKKSLLVTLGLMIFQHLSGIVAVTYYTEFIFKQAKINLRPEICSILLGAVQWLAAFVTPFVIERLGRKKLFLFSSIGIVISQATLSIYYFLEDHNRDLSGVPYLPVMSLLIFIGSYNFGYGPLPWVIMGEIFPSNVKSSAAVFITVFCWTTAFLVAKLFPTVAISIGMGGAFSIFAIGSAMAIPFTHFVLIETKGKQLQEIQEELSK